MRVGGGGEKYLNPMMTERRASEAPVMPANAVVAGEYQYLGKQFGKQDQAWQVAKKAVYQSDDKVYDLITIEFPKGAKQQLFFDITKYFKKP